MENSGFNMIVGAAMIAILIMSVSMSIYNNASSAISDSLSAMSTQEKEMFNNQFTAYEGSQSGSGVKMLINTLITNANTYSGEVEKIPMFSISDKVNSSKDKVSDAYALTVNDVESYVADLGKIREKLETKHTYDVELMYSEKGLVNEIILYYDK